MFRFIPKRNRLDKLSLHKIQCKLLDKKRREIECEADLLLTRKTIKTQGWIVDRGDDEENDNEVYLSLGLTWRRVEDAREAYEVLKYRRNRRKVDPTSPREVRELHEEDFESEDYTKCEYDVNEEENIFIQMKIEY